MGDREFVPGINPVREILLAGKRRVFSLLLAGRDNPRIREVEKLARDRGVAIRRVDRATLQRISAGLPHQGVVAEVSPFEYTSVEEIIRNPVGKFCDMVALDGVSDPHNLGAMVRTAYLLGFDGLVTVRHRSSPVTPTVVKTSAGATEHLPIAMVTNLSRTLDYLKEEGFWVVCASEKADSYLWDLDYDFNVVLVMGDEGRGLRKLTREHCDFSVKIPIRGTETLNSLNVSVAAGIFMYEIRKKQGI